VREAAGKERLQNGVPEEGTLEQVWEDALRNEVETRKNCGGRKAVHSGRCVIGDTLGRES